jgi:chromosome segregation ATPase
MAVGVPEQDVFAAADAVLARGERPTVERVRLELGRGSPARVGALLDQWWEKLAGRLRGETRLPGLPAEVAQAFVAVWQQSTLLAQGVAEMALAGQRQVLDEEREALGELEARARLDVAQARQQAAEAVAAKRGVETRLVDLEQLLAQRQAQIDDLRRQRDELQAQRDESRAQLAEVHQQVQEIREQAEHTRLEQQRYTRDVEDRAYREIDRAREESKALGAQLKDVQGRLSVALGDADKHQRALADTREQLQAARSHGHVLDAQWMQAQRQATEAGEHASRLQEALQAMREDLAEARERAVAAEARAEALVGRSRRSTKKRGSTESSEP